MSEFKVGDRVSYIGFIYTYLKGHIGEVKGKKNDCYDVRFYLGNDEVIEFYIADNELELIAGSKKLTLEDLEQRIEKLEKYASMGKYATDRKENVSNFEKMEQSTVEKRENEPKPSILTEDERVILRNLDKEMYKWIAREENNKLRVCWGKPTKKNGLYWDFTCGYENFYMYNHLFQFIKCTDKEPTSIEELLKGECGNEN